MAGCCADPFPGPGLVTFSKAASKQHVAAWLDLVALVAADPEVNWRSVVVRRAENGAPDSLDLVCPGDTPDDRRRRALAALEVAVDCYRRGRREPIPLFVCLSRKLHDGTAKTDDWESRSGFGDGQDEANRLAFGDLNFNELRALPARPEDPPGHATGRAKRFADHLWNAIEASTEART